jgi:hypothetical protein
VFGEECNMHVLHGDGEFQETLEAIRATLIAQCDQVEELDRRTVVRVWRNWHAAYPLPPKPHGSILEDSIVDRLAAVRGSLTGRHALAARDRQAGDDLFVLCEDALVGWRCRCARVPKLDRINANLIVTSADFSWTLGTDLIRKDRPYREDPVFVKPEMLMEPNLSGKRLSILFPEGEPG